MKRYAIFIAALIFNMAAYATNSTCSTVSYWAQTADHVCIQLINQQQNTYKVQLLNINPITHYFSNTDKNCCEKPRTMENMANNFFFSEPYLIPKNLHTPAFVKSFVAKQKPIAALIFNAVGMSLRERSPVFTVISAYFNAAENKVIYIVKLYNPCDRLQTGVFKRPLVFLNKHN